MTEYKPTIENGIYYLARMADLGDPDDLSSPGAIWLVDVRDSLIEALEYDDFDPEELHELADSAVDIYTYNRWRVFTDLCMWQVDIEDLAGDSSDMTHLAGVAQYESAKTLMYALLQRWEVGEND